jgi:hypothetical protein
MKVSDDDWTPATVMLVEWGPDPRGRRVLGRGVVSRPKRWYWRKGSMDISGTPSELASIMKATLRTGVGHGRRNGAEFRYGRANRDAILRRSEITALDEARLTELEE